MRYNPLDLGTGEQEETAIKLLKYAYKHYPKIVLLNHPFTFGQSRQIAKHISFNQAIAILDKANTLGLFDQRRRSVYNIILELNQHNTKKI